METNFLNENQWMKKKFKSYYVVWKQDTKSSDSAVRKSLNRTMQYGNPYKRLPT